MSDNVPDFECLFPGQCGLGSERACSECYSAHQEKLNDTIERLQRERDEARLQCTAWEQALRLIIDQNEIRHDEILAMLKKC